MHTAGIYESWNKSFCPITQSISYMVLQNEKGCSKFLIYTNYCSPGSLQPLHHFIQQYFLQKKIVCKHFCPQNGCPRTPYLELRLAALVRRVVYGAGM